MAEDIHALVTGLGHRRVKIVAHDFGAAVAYAYAATYRDEVERLAVFEILIPGFGYEDTLVYPFPEDGTGRKVWHMAFHNAPYGIPEFLIGGRERQYLDYFWSHFAHDPSAVSEDERREYARGYSTPGGLHALKYYQTHAQDAEYNRAAAKRPLEMPVMAYGGAAFIGEGVKASLQQVAKQRGRRGDPRLRALGHSGATTVCHRQVAGVSLAMTQRRTRWSRAALNATSSNRVARNVRGSGRPRLLDRRAERDDVRIPVAHDRDPSHRRRGTTIPDLIVCPWTSAGIVRALCLPSVANRGCEKWRGAR